MKLSDFNYHLPQELIAQEQLHPRDHARLMLINRRTQEISHHHVYDLPSLLPKDYFIVANNTKVFPARLIGNKPTGGKVEILLTEPLGHSSYRCIARPGLKVGDMVMFPVVKGSDLKGSAQPRPDNLRGRSDPKVLKAGERTDPQVLNATITSVSGIERTIHFNQEESELRTTLSQIGTMPTPPYIKKLLGNSADYQTIYAKYGFSAAAPTAGLHFTPELLKSIKTQSKWLELTLNVGLGTFLPVKEDDIADHHMHAESYNISPTTSKQIYDLKSSGQKLLSIGTTTMRALESCPTLQSYDLCNSDPCPDSSDPCAIIGERSELLRPGSYTTSIFIYPPYKFQVVDALMTNFHLPGSTLLMLVSAFCSFPNSNEEFTTFADSLLGRAYATAIEEKYRFFSFGDAMLII